jgi:hypothetical protein
MATKLKVGNRYSIIQYNGFITTGTFEGWSQDFKNMVVIKTWDNNFKCHYSYAIAKEDIRAYKELHDKGE